VKLVGVEIDTLEVSIERAATSRSFAVVVLMAPLVAVAPAVVLLLVTADPSSVVLPPENSEATMERPAAPPEVDTVTFRFPEDGRLLILATKTAQASPAEPIWLKRIWV
jgi:hypothetical protein